MGFLHYNGWGVPKDSQRALVFYEAAHKNGNACAAKFLAHVLMETGQITRARSILEQLCKSKKAACCGRHHFAHFLLGKIEHDDGNVTRATGLWKKASAMGSTEATAALARLYATRGDFEDALRLMGKVSGFEERHDTGHNDADEGSDSDLVDDCVDEEHELLEKLLKLSDAMPSKTLKAGILLGGLARLGKQAGADTSHSEHQATSAHVCEHCQLRTAKPLRCSACKSVKYCSQACQKQAWGGHKYVCKS